MRHSLWLAAAGARLRRRENNEAGSRRRSGCNEAAVKEACDELGSTGEDTSLDRVFEQAGDRPA